MLAVLAITALPAHATPLVADMSTYRIDMDANFTGSRIFLFGARNDPGDVVVVVRGPAKDFILRKKENFAGLWLNHGRMKFFGLPAFYAMASSKPLSDIGHGSLLDQLEIGESNLFAPAITEADSAYAQAFLENQRVIKRYAKETGKVEFMGETLFKTVIDFPDNIPPGQYTAELYLLSDNQLVGTQTLPITVVKTGLDAWLYAAAHDYPILYGLSAILMAVAIGWSAGRAFNKT